MSRCESDEQFFKDEVCKHYDSIKKFLYTLTLDSALAEDLVQETMCTCWKNLGRLRRYKKLKSALFVIARNEFLQYQRRKGRRPEELVPTENLSWISSGSNIEEYIDCDENIHRLLLAFRGIRKEYIQVVLLVDYYGFDLKEVAHLLLLNYNTVVSRHTRALKQMRENLERLREGHDPKSRAGGFGRGKDK